MTKALAYVQGNILGGIYEKDIEVEAFAKSSSEEGRGGSGRVELIPTTSSSATVPLPPLSSHSGLLAAPRRPQANSYPSLRFSLLGKPQLSIAPSLASGQT